MQAAPRQSRFQKEAAQTLSEDELCLREAIRNLWPLLSSGTKNRYKDLVDPPKDARLSKLGAEIRRGSDGRME